MTQKDDTTETQLARAEAAIDAYVAAGQVAQRASTALADMGGSAKRTPYDREDPLRAIEHEAGKLQWHRSAYIRLAGLDENLAKLGLGS